MPFIGDAMRISSADASAALDLSIPKVVDSTDPFPAILDHYHLRPESRFVLVGHRD
jgi:hypothetical protein